MIGFEYSIYRQKEFGQSPASLTSEKGKLVSSWQGHSSCIGWFEDLTERQKAIHLQDGYYPSLYTMPAKDALPLLREAPLHAKDCYKWEDGNPIRFPHFYKSDEIISELHASEWLIVEIWDLS
jgi:hypothetical protein